MKKFFLFVFISTHIFGDNLRVVENFLKFKGIQKSIISSEAIEKNNSIVGYIYYLSDGGYIISPSSTNLSPIKAYSLNGSKVENHFLDFLANELYERSINLTSSEKSLEKWLFLENYIENNRELQSISQDTYLLTTNWNQDYPYNKFFPKVGSDITLSGCVQTATAQVMNYHKYPNFGRGVVENNATIKNSYSGIDRYENLKAVLSRNYNWELMDNNYSGDFNESSADEVGYLMRDLAILNRATIGVSETSASLNRRDFIKYFGYSKDLNSTSAEEIGYSQVLDIVKNEIDSERPVLLSLPGHMIVADGYNNDNTGTYIHLNMGWGGSWNAFYNMDEDVITGTNFGQATNNDLRISFNIKPCSIQAGDCYINLEDGDQIRDFNSTASIEIGDRYLSQKIDGNLSSETDIDKYLLYLKGDVNISRANQNYNIALYSIDGALISESLTDPLNLQNLDLGKYFLKVSGIDSRGVYYNFTSREYNLSIVGDEPTAIEKESLDLSKTLQNVSGRLSDLQDEDIFEFYFEGDLNITRENKNYNIALLSKDQKILKESLIDGLHFSNLERDRYFLKVSGFNSNSIYYPFAEGYKDYSLNLLTKELNLSEIKEINLSLNHQPEISNLKDKIFSKGEDTLIYTFDEDGEDLNLSVFYDENLLDASLNKNILTISPKFPESASIVKVVAKSGVDEVENSFVAITKNEPLYFGESFTILGTFTSGTEIVSHEAILKGECSISKSAGYLSIVNEDNSTLNDWDNQNFTTSNLSENIYLFKFSLKNPSTNYYYNFDENTSKYKISVSCSDSVDGNRVAEILNFTVSSNFSNEANSTLDQNNTNISTSSIPLINGWNLISNPFSNDNNWSNISNLDISYSFSYDNDWLFCGGTETTDIFQTFSTFEPHHGYWIKTSAETSINFTGETFSSCPDTSNLNHGWYLLGSCEENNLSRIFEENSDSLILYKFTNNHWSAFSSRSGINDILSNSGISLFNSLSKHEGFWLYVE